MAGRREDIELALVLDDPQCAREYVEHFDWGGPAPKHIVLSPDNRVPLDALTDEEAVIAAHIILNDVEIKAAMREKNLERWEQ